MPQVLLAKNTCDATAAGNRRRTLVAPHDLSLHVANVD